MTANQINYARLKEDTRHNLATENETAKHNRAQESIGYGGLAETSRHNAATEQVNWYTAQGLVSLQNAQRDKAYSEVGVQSAQVEEQSRHNVVTESQANRQIVETFRHNLETEKDTDYSNVTKRGEAITEGIRDISSSVFGNKGIVGGILSVPQYLKPTSKTK